MHMTINKAIQSDGKVLPWAKYRRLPAKPPFEPLQTGRCCPNCGGEEDDVLFELTDFQFYTDWEGVNRALHRVVRCGDCGLMYTNPRYTEAGFALLFAQAGMSYGQSPGRATEQAAWILKQVPHLKRIADIGCSDGALLKVFPKSIERFGADIDERGLQVARANVPGGTFTKTDFTSAIDIPSCDVVTMFHVLEHLPDPLETLTLLHRQSSEQTRLIVEVPVLERAATEQREDLVGFFTIQHLTHFTKRTLHAMLLRAGWHVVEAEEIDGYNGYRVVAEVTQPGQPVVDQAVIGEEIQRSVAYLGIWLRSIAQLDHRLAQLAGHDHVMVWGAGQHTEYMAQITHLFDASTQYVVIDSDPAKQGHTLHGISVIAPHDVPDAQWRQGTAPIVISTYGGQGDVQRWLLDHGVAKERIITLYDNVNRY